MGSPVRGVFHLIACFLWLLTTGHCALAAAAERTGESAAAAHAHCGSAEEQSSLPACEGGECCQLALTAPGVYAPELVTYLVPLSPLRRHEDQRPAVGSVMRILAAHPPPLPLSSLLFDSLSCAANAPPSLA